MTRPINLNKARKAKQRSEAQARADQNRIKFGRTKAQKNQDTADLESFRSKIDRHKRDNEPDKDGRS